MNDKNAQLKVFLPPQPNETDRMSLGRIITDWQLDLELMNKESRDILYLRAFGTRKLQKVHIYGLHSN